MNRLGLLLVIMLFAACDKKNIGTKKCGDIACTENFAMITIRFVDKGGNGVGVKNYSSVNQRTGDTITTIADTFANVVPGTRFVVDDSYTKKLSESGDELKVTGTDSVTNQTKTAIIKVSGGQCACHVEKISGPDKIQFD